MLVCIQWYVSFIEIHFRSASGEGRRFLSALSRATRLTSPHKSLEHFVPPGPSCTIYISADSLRKNWPVISSNFGLPELKASQKFSVHVHVDRPRAQLRKLKEAKDHRYKLKEGNSKLK